MKRRYGNDKTKRLSGYISAQFQSEIQKDAKDTGVSQADLIEIAYIEMKLRKKELFVICPKCNSLFYPYALLNIEGTMKCKCKNCSHEFEEDITNT